MDSKKRWRLNFLLAFLSIQIAVCDDTCRETYTKKFVRQVQASNDTYEKHQTRQEPLGYTILRLEGKDIPTKDLLCLHDTSCNTVAPKAVTIITMRKRDRDVSDCKDTIMTNLISAIQQNINDESLTSFSIGNMIVAINSVEKEKMPGYLMLSNADEKLRMVICKLNTLIIEVFEILISETHRQWMIDWFYLYVKTLIQPHTKEEPNFPHLWCKLRDYTDNIYQNFCNDLEDYFDVFTSYRDFKAEVLRYKSEFDKVPAKLFEYEDSIGFRYFSKNVALFESTYSQAYKAYEVLASKTCKASIMAGCKVMANENNRIKTKEAFDFAFNVIEKSPDFKAFLRRDAETTNETNFSEINDIYQNYCKSIGLDVLYIDFCKSHQYVFNKLHKRFQAHKTVKIVINEKLSIDTFNLVCRILCSEFNADLNGFQSMYVDIGRNIVQPILVTGSNPLDAKSVVLKNGTKITVSDGEKLEVVSKSIDKVRKKNVNGSLYSHSVHILDMSESVACSKENEKMVAETRETVERMILEYEITEEIKTSMLACLEKNNSRPTGLHKITVPSSTQLTEIYILNHQLIGDKSEKLLVIYADIVVDQPGSNKVKRIQIFDNIQDLHLYDLYNQLQCFQAAKAEKFIIPNVLSIAEKPYIYMEYWLDQKIASASYCIEKFFDKIQYWQLKGRYAKDIFTGEILNFKDYSEKFIAAENERWDAINLGIPQAELNLLIKKFLLNINFVEDELDNPCINNILEMRCDLYIASELVGIEKILYIWIENVNESIDCLSQNPLQIVKKLLNVKHKKSVLDALSQISIQMTNDSNIIPMVIDEMINCKDFGILSTENSEYQYSYVLYVLRILGNLFGYTDNWKSECYSDDHEAKYNGSLVSGQRGMIKSKIESLLKIILEDKEHSECSTTTKATSIKKLTPIVIDENKKPAGSISNEIEILCGDFDRFEVSKTNFTESNRAGRYKEKNKK